MAKKLRRQEKNNEQRETSRDDSPNYSSRFHLSNGLTAAVGLSGREVGRAKSPVLKASALAVVKIADCVS